MRNSEKFQTILDDLNADDLDTMRNFILATVKAEYGELIDNLQNLIEGGDETDEAEMPADPFVTQAPPSVVEFLKALGLLNAPVAQGFRIEVRRIK